MPRTKLGQIIKERKHDSDTVRTIFSLVTVLKDEALLARLVKDKLGTEKLIKFTQFLELHPKLDPDLSDSQNFARAWLFWQYANGLMWCYCPPEIRWDTYPFCEDSWKTMVELMKPEWEEIEAIQALFAHVHGVALLWEDRPASVDDMLIEYLTYHMNIALEELKDLNLANKTYPRHEGERRLIDLRSIEDYLFLKKNKPVQNLNEPPIFIKMLEQLKLLILKEDGKVKGRNKTPAALLWNNYATKERKIARAIRDGMDSKALPTAGKDIVNRKKRQRKAVCTLL